MLYKTALYLFFQLLLTIPCLAQNINLNSQADVDAFDTSITEINGYLRIETTDDTDPIVDLSNLLNLTAVDGNLEINDNAALMNVDGLANLTAIGGGLRLWNNVALTNVDGLANLTAINGDLEMIYNETLTNLTGFANVTVIDGNLDLNNNLALTNVDGLANVTAIGGGLRILNSTALTNVDGMINITSIGGGSEIKDNVALINVDGLANVSTIGGDLLLWNNTSLTNIDGLANVTAIGGDLWILKNADLTNVDSLANLTAIVGELRIWNNTTLTNINGLANITSIVEDFRIEENATLTNIDGLASLTAIGGSLFITYNDALTNVSGLANLTAIGGNLEMYSNPVLTDCCGIATLLLIPNGIGGNIDISDNPSVCSSFNEVLDACNISTLSGFFFYDENENGLKDALEYGLNLQSISTEPNQFTYYSQEDGEYRIYAENGSYLLTPNIPQGWLLSSDSSTYTVSVMNENVEGLNFGFIPLEEINAIHTDLTSAATRCGFTVPFWLNYQNTGTLISTGNITLALDPLTTYISANPEPTTIDGNTLTWNYADLPPTSGNQINLQLEMPGVDNLGDTLHFFTTATALDMDGNAIIAGTSEYHSVVNCAYDPNDKQVMPMGVEEAQYTLFGQTLEYRVRFQNTGTDTAFTVRVTDQLDNNLDWTTFQPLHASHPFEVTLSEDGLVEFLFENILLPDSMTNNIGSNGYFMYQIDLLENLPENTIVENTADIFFDFNPPIQTNTTLNTFVTELPTATREIKSLVAIRVFPNPFSDYTNIVIGGLPDEQKAVLFIRDILGNIVEQRLMNANSTIQVGHMDLPAHLYFYELRGRDTDVLLGSGKLVRE